MAEVTDLKDIAEAGLAAPSGDNLQPWKFFVDHTGIDIHIDPAKIHSVFDFRRRGSLVAIGAAIENMNVAAKRFGKTTDVKYFPSNDDPNLIARLEFVSDRGEGSEEDMHLYEQIELRGVNRKPYKNIPLTEEARTQILSIPSRIGVPGSVRLVEEPEKRHALARLTNTFDRFIFLNRHTHDGLFENVCWTPEEAGKKRIGLDVRTLELAAPDQKMFRLLKSWSFARFMGLFGAADMVAHKTEKVFLTGSAIVAVVLPGETEEDFINGGRITERVWLEAGLHGLSAHPAYGFILLGQRARSDHSVFSPSQLKLINAAYDKTCAAFNVEGKETITMAFRLGVPVAPASARSVRQYPEDLITYKT